MSNPIHFPVFVVGSSRSGTTLVYSMLLASGDFAIYQAETLLLNVCRPKYGSLGKEKQYQRFIHDWIRSKQFFRSGLDPFEFQREARKHRSSYLDFLGFFMQSIARKQGKKRWAEQTPEHLFHMEVLLEAFPSSKFIHVIRDGRDVALSRRKLGWIGTRSADPMKQLISAALSWEICIKAGQACGKQLASRYREIRYEDIINHLDDVLEEISCFTNTRIDRKRLNDNAIGSLRKANTAFGDEMQGISDKGLYRWKSELSSSEIQVLNLCIGRTLSQLGYEVGTSYDEADQLVRIRKMKAYSILHRRLLNFKRFLVQKTLLGRFSSAAIEIGLQ